MNFNNPKRVSGPDPAILSEAPGLDRLRLKQKALAVIARTPEIRRRRVQLIKELVSLGSFDCNVHQVAFKLIADHCLIMGLAASEPGSGHISEDGTKASGARRR